MVLFAGCGSQHVNGLAAAIGVDLGKPLRMDRH
jgi:hypothetical protein